LLKFDDESECALPADAITYRGRRRLNDRARSEEIRRTIDFVRVVRRDTRRYLAVIEPPAEYDSPVREQKREREVTSLNRLSAAAT
jgi:hypothetical protein